MRYLYTIVITVLLSACSSGKLSYYAQGNLHTRVFLDHATHRQQLVGDYYAVKRNDKGQVKQARHYGPQRQLLEKSHYTYSRKGQLTRHQLTEYFQTGPPRVTREWHYHNGKVLSREEKWFTRGRSLEKKLTIHYDNEQKPYLEETWGLGNKILNSTEYYYDYKHRLDKSRRNFFFSDGSLRDYWITIYNDAVQIINEEHYLPDNSLLSFYRYSYDPVHGYRQREEILDEERNIFISRTYDPYGYLLVEIERDHALTQLKRRVYHYNEKHQPQTVQVYNAADHLVKTARYKQLRTLESFRTPGL